MDLTCLSWRTHKMLDWIEIWFILKPSQYFKLVVVPLRLLLNHFCFVAGHLILLKEATAIREYCERCIWSATMFR